MHVSLQGVQGSIPGVVAPGFLHLEIVLEDAVSRRVSSRISRPLVFVRGSMNTAEAYCNILDNEMLPTLWRFYGMDPCYFQDDHARCHVSRAVVRRQQCSPIGLARPEPRPQPYRTSLVELNHRALLKSRKFASLRRPAAGTLAAPGRPQQAPAVSRALPTSHVPGVNFCECLPSANSGACHASQTPYPPENFASPPPPVPYQPSPLSSSEIPPTSHCAKMSSDCRVVMPGPVSTVCIYLNGRAESGQRGAAVAERLDCSPTTKENQVHCPAGSLPNSHTRESCWTMRLVRWVSLGISLAHDERTGDEQLDSSLPGAKQIQRTAGVKAGLRSVSRLPHMVTQRMRTGQGLPGVWREARRRPAIRHATKSPAVVVGRICRSLEVPPEFTPPWRVQERGGEKRSSSILFQGRFILSIAPRRVFDMVSLLKTVVGVEPGLHYDNEPSVQIGLHRVLAVKQRGRRMGEGVRSPCSRLLARHDEAPPCRNEGGGAKPPIRPRHRVDKNIVFRKEEGKEEMSCSWSVKKLLPGIPASLLLPLHPSTPSQCASLRIVYQLRESLEVQRPGGGVEDAFRLSNQEGRIGSLSWHAVARFDSWRGSSRIFACGNRAGGCPWSAGFLGNLPFPPPFHSGTDPYSPRFTLIFSQDTDAQCRPNPFTHSLTYINLRYLLDLHETYSCPVAPKSSPIRNRMIRVPNKDPDFEPPISAVRNELHLDLPSCSELERCNSFVSILDPISDRILNPDGATGHYSAKCQTRSTAFGIITWANWLRFPTETLPDFRMWESCQTTPLVGVFSRTRCREPLEVLCRWVKALSSGAVDGDLHRRLCRKESRVQGCGSPGTGEPLWVYVARFISPEVRVVLAFTMARRACRPLHQTCLHPPQDKGTKEERITSPRAAAGALYPAQLITGRRDETMSGRRFHSNEIRHRRYAQGSELECSVLIVLSVLMGLYVVTSSVYWRKAFTVAGSYLDKTAHRSGVAGEREIKGCARSRRLWPARYGCRTAFGLSVLDRTTELARPDICRILYTPQDRTTKLARPDICRILYTPQDRTTKLARPDICRILYTPQDRTTELARPDICGYCSEVQCRLLSWLRSFVGLSSNEAPAPPPSPCYRGAGTSTATQAAELTSLSARDDMTPGAVSGPIRRAGGAGTSTATQAAELTSLSARDDMTPGAVSGPIRRAGGAGTSTATQAAELTSLPARDDMTPGAVSGPIRRAGGAGTSTATQAAELTSLSARDDMTPGAVSGPIRRAGGAGTSTATQAAELTSLPARYDMTPEAVSGPIRRAGGAGTSTATQAAELTSLPARYDMTPEAVSGPIRRAGGAGTSTATQAAKLTSLSARDDMAPGAVSGPIRRAGGAGTTATQAAELTSLPARDDMAPGL
ncbi:hypothetical protein PR048_003891 [Dryococelus australis]|uniref:Uncharacterized protein n=1 Tax=Dryococelus australis TaxID=614101 RepID=A0ABQ9IP91_9NEOP|nr:hypothetical protein PR048_003891 [Dryococelus australis]